MWNRGQASVTGARRRVWRDLAAMALMLAGFAASPATAQTPAYVGSQGCAECHASEAAAWRGSDHGNAWTQPTADTVLGDFADATYEHAGRISRFFMQDGDYYIETDDAAGARRPFKVVGLAGVDPLQQYLISPEPGRTQVYDIAWDVEAGRWYPVFPDQDARPGNGFHWTGPYKSWEARCAECHATGYSRNYRPETRTYAPQMAETSVGCEACHGPGAAHADWARTGKAPSLPGLGPTGLTITLDAPGARAEVGQCMACHSLREALADGNMLPGTDYHDAYTLSLLREGQYHPDGSILGEVFEGGSFLQSKMNAKGVTCSHCHEPHSGALRAEGNAVCTQCHSPAGNPDFPSLPLRVFDGPEHHFHPEGSTGAQCVSCHMPERTYMGVDERRDHAFRIPRPDLAATGSPDACTGCHADRDPSWAAAELERRFPDSTHRGPHFATAFAAARLAPGSNTGQLLDIAEWDGPGIVRASAIDLLPDLPPGPDADRLTRLLSDPDPLVRAAAAQPLRGLSPEARAALVGPLLTDPLRSVRIGAARALFDLPQAGAPPPGLIEAVREWQAALAVTDDFPETHLKIGGAALALRDLRTATSAFREAVRQDPQLVPAWSMLVRIPAAVGDMAGARSALAEALRLNPGDPGLFDLELQLGLGDNSLLPPQGD